VSFRFEHVPTRRVVAIETRAGLRHCLGSPWWRELREGSVTVGEGVTVDITAAGDGVVVHDVETPLGVIPVVAVEGRP
jgi:hypothetical protein